MTFKLFICMIFTTIAFMAVFDLFNHFAKKPLCKIGLELTYHLQAWWERHWLPHLWEVDNIKRRDAKAKEVQVEYLPLEEAKKDSWSWAVEVQDVELIQYTTKEIKEPKLLDK